MTTSFFGFIGSIGTPELIFVFVLILFLFGAQKVPEIMRSLGEGVREFRRSSRDIMREFESEIPRPTPARSKPWAASDATSKRSDSSASKSSTPSEASGVAASLPGSVQDHNQD